MINFWLPSLKLYTSQFPGHKSIVNLTFNCRLRTNCVASIIIYFKCSSGWNSKHNSQKIKTSFSLHFFLFSTIFQSASHRLIELDGASKIHTKDRVKWGKCDSFLQSWTLNYRKLRSMRRKEFWLLLLCLKSNWEWLFMTRITIMLSH